MNLIALPRCNQVVLLDVERLIRVANGDHSDQT
jgi:hypothetical protein